MRLNLKLLFSFLVAGILASCSASKYHIETWQKPDGATDSTLTTISAYDAKDRLIEKKELRDDLTKSYEYLGETSHVLVESWSSPKQNKYYPRPYLIMKSTFQGDSLLKSVEETYNGKVRDYEEYFYNERGELVKEFLYAERGLTDMEIYYTYENGRKKTSKRFSGTIYGSEKKPAHNIEYKYNDAGQVDSVIFYSTHPKHNDRIQTNEYNSNGDVIDRKEFEVIDGNDYLLYQWVSHYDANNRLIKLEVYKVEEGTKNLSNTVYYLKKK